MSAAEWRSFCLGLNVLKIGHKGSRSSDDPLGDMPGWTGQR